MAELTKLTGTYIRSGSIPTTALSGGVVSSSLQVISALPTGSVSSSAQVVELLPIGTVSSSTQVDYTVLSNVPAGIASSSAQVTAYLPTNTVSSSGQVTSFLPTNTVSSSGQVTAFLPTGTVSQSSQVDITGTTNYTSFSSSLATVDTAQTNRLTTLESVTGSYATTGSNTFVAPQTISDTTNSTSYLDGALHVAGGMSVRQDVRISGSMTINGLLTAVSMSTQYVTSSQYNVGVSRITLNDDDNVRFAGLSIIDSGSASPASASIFWDSLQHRFIYENLSGSSYNSSIIIAGPKHTGSLGDEPTLTSGYISYATGGDHIDNSIIFQSASNIGVGTTIPSEKFEVLGGGLSVNSGTIKTVVAYASTGLIGTATNHDLSLLTNSSTKVTILAAGNVGIGTTNPTQKLHISGSGTVVSLLDSSGTYAISRVKNSTLQADIGVDTTGLYMDTVGGTYPIVFYTNGSERMRISGSGNVGIGITNPTVNLQVSGTIATGDATNGWGRLSYDTNVVRLIGSKNGTDAVDMALSTQASGGTLSEKMRITGAGNVGIGTTNPAVALDIRGQTQIITNSEYQLDVQSVNSSAGASIRRYSTSAYAYDVYQTSHHWRAGILGSTAYTIYDYTNLTDRLTILTTGNVGIGLTNPTALLDVNGTSTIRGTLIVSGSGQTIHRIQSTGASGYPTLVMSNTNASSTAANYFSISVARDNADSEPVSTLTLIANDTTVSNRQLFAINNYATRVFTVAASGNVGIGTTNPLRKLHVTATDASIASFNGANTGLVIQDNSSGLNQVELVGYRQDDNSYNNVLIRGASGGLLISSAGNVGIGTTSPDVTFQVNSTIGGGGLAHFVSTTTESSTTYRINSSGVNTGWVTGNANNSYFIYSYTLSGQAVSILSNGNVGIGTTNPTQKLHVNGRIQLNAGNIVGNFQSAHTNNGSVYWDFGSKADGTNLTGMRVTQVWDGTYNDEAIEFLTHNGGVSAGVKMIIDTNGNVGINTSSPQSVLDVRGISLFGDFGSSGAYNSNAAIHVRKTKPHIIVESIGTNTCAIAGQGSTWGLVFAVENGGMEWRTGCTWNGDFTATGTQRMTLSSGGNLTVSGTITESSSMKIKKNINPITDALALVNNLNGYTYDRIDNDSTNQAGLIAEEVVQVLPGVVSLDQDGNPAGVQYTKIIAYLVESIKELKSELDALKGQ